MTGEWWIDPATGLLTCPDCGRTSGPTNLCPVCRGTGSVPCPEHGLPCFNACPACAASGRISTPETEKEPT